MIYGVVKYLTTSITLEEAWIKEKLSKDNCLYQSALFWNDDFNNIKQKVSIELGLGNKDLDLDQTQT